MQLADDSGQRGQRLAALEVVFQLLELDADAEVVGGEGADVADAAFEDQFLVPLAVEQDDAEALVVSEARPIPAWQWTSTGSRSACAAPMNATAS